jgi:hypothetical protein
MYGPEVAAPEAMLRLTGMCPPQHGPCAQLIGQAAAPISLQQHAYIRLPHTHTKKNLVPTPPRPRAHLAARKSYSYFLERKSASCFLGQPMLTAPDSMSSASPLSSGSAGGRGKGGWGVGGKGASGQAGG